MNKLTYLIYGLWAALLLGLYLAFPVAGQYAGLVLELTTVGIIIWQVFRFKLTTWMGWLLVVIAGTFMLAGNTYTGLFGGTTFPSWGDLFYLPDLPLFSVGMYIIIKRRSSAKSDHATVLDATTLTLGLALLVWVYLIEPTASASTPLLTKIVSLAYPLSDILAAAIAIRLFIIDPKSMPSRMMAIGLSGFATSDVFYGLFRFYGVTDQTVYGVLGLGILSCYISFAVGALHPSMKTMDQPLPDLPPVRIWRLILLAGAALIAPVVLFIETFRGRVEEVAPIVAVFSAVMFTLVIMRLFTLIRDISQRDAEITLERQRTELIYLASHQLRTPAAAVKSSLSLLIDGYLGKLSEKQEQELKVAYEENDHELQLVNDILNVIQLDSRNLPIEVKPTDLAAVVKEAVKGELPTAESKHQKLTVGPAEQAVAEVDADKLLTVMKVLVTNAVKYTPDDGVIQLSVSDGRDQVVVRVKDNGIGISDDDLPDLFKRFSRARNATQINMAGAGLGLYIAKNIVEAHHGTIEVDSELGHGSVFTVKVPKKFLS